MRVYQLTFLIGFLFIPLNILYLNMRRVGGGIILPSRRDIFVGYGGCIIIQPSPSRKDYARWQRGGSPTESMFQ